MLAGTAEIHAENLAAIAKRKRIIGVVSDPSQSRMMALEGANRIVADSIAAAAMLIAVGDVLCRLKHHRTVEFELALIHLRASIPEQSGVGRRPDRRRENWSAVSGVRCFCRKDFRSRQ